MPAPQRFIILPPLGVRLASAGIRLARRALPLEHFLASIARPARRVVARGGEGAAATMQVLDSVHADGAKLVEMRPEDVVRLRSVQPGVRIVPEVFFRPARAPRPQVLSVAAAAARKTVTRDAARGVARRRKAGRRRRRDRVHRLRGERGRAGTHGRRGQGAAAPAGDGAEGRAPLRLSGARVLGRAREEHGGEGGDGRRRCGRSTCARPTRCATSTASRRSRWGAR